MGRPGFRRRPDISGEGFTDPEEGGDAGEDEDGQYNLKFCGVTSPLHL